MQSTSNDVYLQRVMMHLPKHTWTKWDAPARNHVSCIHQNKYPVLGDEYNSHDSLQAHLIQGTGY